MRLETLWVRVPMTIVTPGEEHLLGIAETTSTALNFSRERAIARSPFWPLEDMRVAIEDGMVVATAGDFRFDQWFGGRSMGCSGIWGVATLPEHREGGLATACIRALLDRARERGVPLTALFPAVLTPYRRMGYEIAGVFIRHRVPLDALPPGDDTLPSVELADVSRDVGGMHAAFREWISTSNGPVEPVTDDLWISRLLPASDDDTGRTVVVREDGRITGVASFTRETEPGLLDVAFGVDCRTLFAVTPTAQRALWSYFRGYRGLGTWLQWVGPANDPIALGSIDAFIERPYRYDWMLRLLDVPAALEARGYPAIDAEATFTVDDAMYPDNAGAWHVSVSGGRASAERLDGHDRQALPIGVLSSMFSGYLRAHDAVRLGYLDADDPAVDALAAIFDGPDPWSPFFF
ncbi:MAG: GNAT family N-acetyltransferase [Actinomycetota bacterium]